MAVLFLFCALDGSCHEVHDHFDMLEVNHLHNRYGSTIFVQLIYWDWYEEDRRFHAQGWRIMKDAFDTSDANHRREYEAELDRWLRQVKNIGRRSEIRGQMPYKGKFVGGRLYPIKQHRTGLYQVRFMDEGIARVITARQFRETHTTHDPERADRKYFEKSARRGLTIPPKSGTTLR